MPPALQTWECQKFPANGAKRKLRYFKDENNAFNMNSSEPLVSCNSDEAWRHAPPSCFGSEDHRESSKDLVSLIDHHSHLDAESPVAFSISSTLQKKTGLAERREVDRNIKRGATAGLHRRQRSGDLYTKLESCDSGDILPRRRDQPLGTSDAISSRYVVTGHGSWGEYGDSCCSQDLETITTKKCSKKKLSASESDYGSFPVTTALSPREGIPLPPGTGHVGGVSGLKEWYKNRTLVSKATSKAEAPPKSKYLRKLVLSSWKNNGAGAAAIFNILSKRPLHSSPIIALKALITIHKLMQQGSPDCCEACYSRLPLVTDMENAFNHRDENLADSYGPLVCAYASMVAEKASFHHRFPAYANNYSVDVGDITSQPSSSGEQTRDPLRPKALGCLQRIQETNLLALEQGFNLLRKKFDAAGAKGAGTRNAPASGALGVGGLKGGADSDPIELVASVLISILREADLVYDICWFLLSSQFSVRRRSGSGHETSALANEMVAKFAAQHKTLRSFFEQANSVVAITSNVTPPSLPFDPPCPAAAPRNPVLRLFPSAKATGADKERAGNRCNSEPGDLDSFPDNEAARPRSVPVEGKGSLELADDLGTDRSWACMSAQQPSVGGKALPRQEVNGPVLGGVGAAAAAAMQRFAAGQAEARRVAAAAAEIGVPPPTGLRNIRLEPPPGNPGFHLEFGTFVRPGRPQHTRGNGRTWSSFDDEAFLHQQLVENPWSPIPRLVSPKFYSPRAPGPPNHVKDLLSPNQLDSSSPLLLGPASPSPENRPRAPPCMFPAATTVVESRPPPLPAIESTTKNQQLQVQSPEAQKTPKYSVSATHVSEARLEKLPFEKPPLIELDTVDEEQSTDNEELRTVDRVRIGAEEGQGCRAPPSWQVEGSMSDSAAWSAFEPSADGQHKAEFRETSRNESVSDIPLAADWEIPVCELKLGPKIGQGAFGDVLRGTWQGTDVAVKRLQNNLVTSYSQALMDIRHEVAVIMRLRHPNIILFMGACTVPPEICIVMEFAANGSLYGVLHNPNIAIDMATVVRWASDAARGMTYLHTRNPPVVHRDLKSANLLVDGDWHIKVSDFGLAMTKQNSHAYTQVGTWGWMAPEVLESAPYDEKADVYSFGVVLWELITREEPFKGYHPMQIMRAIDRGERPAIPESCPHSYRQLVQDCWHTNSKSRPMFEEVLGRLGAMSNILPENAR